MEVLSVKFREKECFRDELAGFDEFKLLNVIIGKNNVGKSRLLDLVHRCCEMPLPFSFEGTFAKCRLGDALGVRLANELFHGRFRNIEEIREKCKGVEVGFTWQNGASCEIDIVNREVFDEPPYNGRWNDVLGLTRQIVGKNFQHPYHGAKFLHLYADRDIREEKESREVDLGPRGEWATDLIQHVLNSGSVSDECVTKDLLGGLNKVFAGDGEFLSIQAKRTSEKNNSEGVWEVFLVEESKGRVALSKSGSGLKTVILVLLFLHVCPAVVHPKLGKFVYAFEELENNLHPSLFRRLLSYIVDFAREKKAPIYITTHSSVALDVFGTMEDAQIVHVKHDGRSGRTFPVKAHFDKFNVVAELGAKPSDLLQANGLIWVEGPSDRVYVDRWIQLYAAGRYKEGIHYQCVFYGGALLARLEVAWDEQHKKDFVNLLKVNGNLAVIMDSDRKRGVGGNELKARVKRLVDEVESVGAFQWVTWGKEIESYLPGAALSQVFGKSCRDPFKDELFFPPSGTKEKSKIKPTPSYVGAVLDGKRFDKTERALQITPFLTVEEMAKRGDWSTKMSKLVQQIEKWNK